MRRKKWNCHTPLIDYIEIHKTKVRQLQQCVKSYVVQRHQKRVQSKGKHVEHGDTMALVLQSMLPKSFWIHSHYISRAEVRQSSHYFLPAWVKGCSSLRLICVNVSVQSNSRCEHPRSGKQKAQGFQTHRALPPLTALHNCLLIPLLHGVYGECLSVGARLQSLIRADLSPMALLLFGVGGG